MAKTPLQTGYNIIINQKVGAVNTPIYPFTRTANVKDATGSTLDEIIATLATKAEAEGNYVPERASEVVSNLRFLRNDNTWATIQDATLAQKGVVQLSNATNLDDSTVAATAKAVKLVQDAVDALGGNAADTYVQKTQLGAATANGVTGVATLDANGLVPSTQLPSYVDDVVEVSMGADLKSATLAGGTTVTPESGKIYVDCVGENATEKTYRWSGTTYVVISETLALGETSSTAFRGDQGKTAYDHSQAAHARVDATLTENSDNNGYIKINGGEVLVYTHPTVEGGTATNPHGTTKADVGLGAVENKTSEQIRSELTSVNVTTALGYTPANVATLATAAQNGLMSSTYAGKLDNCMETAVGTEAPTFANGLWFQIIPDEA